MKHLALLTALCGTTLHFPIILAAPAKPVTHTPLAIPAEVREQMVLGAETLHFARLPIGPGGAPALLHAWKAVRRSSLVKQRGPLAPSPVCIDLFFKNGAMDKAWRLSASTAYLDDSDGYEGETTYETHWLQTKTKKGLVIVERNSNSLASTIRVLTLPEGVREPILSHISPIYMQKFSSFYNGGSLSSFISFRRNAHGQLTVQEEILPKANVSATLNTYGWNGSQWARVTSKRVRR